MPASPHTCVSQRHEPNSRSQCKQKEENSRSTKGILVTLPKSTN